MTHLPPGHWATAGHLIGRKRRECVVKNEVPVSVSPGEQVGWETHLTLLPLVKGPAWACFLVHRRQLYTAPGSGHAETGRSRARGETNPHYRRWAVVHPMYGHHTCRKNTSLPHLVSSSSSNSLKTLRVTCEKARLVKGRLGLPVSLASCCIALTTCWHSFTPALMAFMRSCWSTLSPPPSSITVMSNGTQTSVMVADEERDKYSTHLTSIPSVSSLPSHTNSTSHQ
ncbi:hypothetical protein E2C01_014990 [Portunus trituberculatus]|uniref:Uncharacterized protein n=1 Tax=Portunus trituberculatus TaxID=210409 RepID=A0A5B7DLY3_PORTR|nr:hypothetical protein [Portunus trituberculatus]